MTKQQLPQQSQPEKEPNPAILLEKQNQNSSLSLRKNPASLTGSDSASVRDNPVIADIQIENEFIEDALPEAGIKHENKQENSKNAQEFIKVFLNQSIVTAVNLALPDNTVKLTDKEVEETQFSENTIKLLDYYFPGLKWLNHPILPCLISTGALIMLINARRMPKNAGKPAEPPEENSS